MQTNLEKTASQKWLFYCFIGFAIAIVFANQFGEETATIVANLLYLPLTGVWVAIAIALFARFRITGKHGKAWIFFLAAAVSFFIAETVWSVEEMILEIEPYPSTADVFYLLGYPLFFMFSIYYISPVKKAVTKKMIVASSLVAIGIFTPTLYLSLSVGDLVTDISLLEFLVGASYPVADAILIIPALIGLTLFFKGEVNFLWTLIFIGFLIMAAADTAFLSAVIEDSYFTGHPLEILFYWAYICFVFGAFNHYKIFKTRFTKKNIKS